MDVADQSFRFAGGRVGFLLIHGLGGTPMELRYVARGLARAGYTVHVPQLAGHCGSEDDLRATGWSDWYASVEAEHHRLKQHCDKIVVGGLSMGAIMAVHHAARHPDDVFALALYAPTLWLDGWGIPWYTSLFGLLTRSGLRTTSGSRRGTRGASRTCACGRWSSRPSIAATARAPASPPCPAA